MVALILLLQALVPVKCKSEVNRVDGQQPYFEFNNEFLAHIVKIPFAHALETVPNVVFD